MVKNLLCDAGDMGLSAGQETKISCAKTELTGCEY